MRKFVCIVTIPTVVTYLFSNLVYDFEFLYYMAFGLIVVGIDIFTVGLYQEISSIKSLKLISYLLILLSNVLLINGVLLFYLSDVSIWYRFMTAIIIGIPVSIFVYKKFFINHIAGKLILEK